MVMPLTISLVGTAKRRGWVLVRTIALRALALGAVLLLSGCYKAPPALDPATPIENSAPPAMADATPPRKDVAEPAPNAAPAPIRAAGEPDPAVRHPKALAPISVQTEELPPEHDPPRADEESKRARATAPKRAVDAPRAAAPAFAVHITSYRTLAGARKDWKRLVDRHPEQLFGLRARVSTIDLGPPRGRFYRLKAGPLPSRRFAKKLCGSLRRRGLYCAVMRFTGQPIG